MSSIFILKEICSSGALWISENNIPYDDKQAIMYRGLVIMRSQEHSFTETIS